MSGKANKEFEEQLRLQELYSKTSHDASNPLTYTDPNDGTVYDWDHDKKAWFPKITEDFMAAYQANYGFNQEGNPDATAAAAATKPVATEGEKRAAAEEEPISEQQTSTGVDGKRKGEKRKPDPGWFDMEDTKNTNVYVSGLPPDTSAEEFVELMSKCGIVMRDPITEDYKVKLYKDKDGNLKGDGLCCYLKRESVELAVRLMDESEIRGYKVHVEAARFQLKGQYDASKKKKKNKDYRKKMQMQQKQLDWRPEKQGDARKRHEKVVIIRNMFHPTDFEEDPLVLNEYREDLRSECEKFGEVKKVILFDRHPDGVASVAFKEQEHADACILSFHGRWFGGRQLSAQLWDGTTDYQVEETSREREERLKGWSSFLEGAQQGGGGPNLPPGGATEASSAAPPKTTSQPQPDKTQEGKKEDDDDAKSTDSSLAGSDDDDNA
ncbi:HIV Tat-specific factor 1 [Syngnathus typhle]|uniref:HIV Tat-specific factor 1 n=1 Tax=Syngnathus typhle TaxID=161592 RepID=UPI002A69E2A1|nr:HIV Tat-specific factor 1 [Syngnathus typhle]